ncbi:MAG: Ig-like domain-containing protein, partial [Thermoplasmata archaeon]|nr:Ig-like domain-containing protein [Thermoplasmata archaeon]
MALFLSIGVPMTAFVGGEDPVPGPDSDRGVEPDPHSGNPQGGDDNTNVGYFNPSLFEYKIQDLDEDSSGTYTSTDGYLKISIDVTDDDTDGPSFDWEIASGSTVKALEGIFVKGGNGGNWYDYSGFTDVSGVVGADWDGYLHSPLGAGSGGSKFYGLSHVSFGYAIEPDAYITIASDDTNKVGDPHTFTVTVWEDSTADGEMGDFERAAGETVTVTFESLYGADTISPKTGTTDSNGEYTVTINSQNAGQIIATASSQVDVDERTLTRTTDGTSTPNGGKNSGPATKTYVSAKISIETDDTNAVTSSHTFTIKLQRDLGDDIGYVPFSGQTVTASLTGVGYFESSSTQTTDVSGEVKVTINSAVTGLSTISASFEGEIVAGNAATKVIISTDDTGDNSAPAEKTYVNARISIKDPGDNVVGNLHTFTILLERDLG